MFYRFLLFVLLLSVITFYMVTNGITHPVTSSPGSDSWDGGSAAWEMETDESAQDHSTITAYASANVTRYKREDTNGSGSEDEFDEYGLAHARVSATTLSVEIGGELETQEPIGTAYHEANIFTYMVVNGFNHYFEHTEGDNNISPVALLDYRGPYNEATSAYNSNPTYWSLAGLGRCGISNEKEIWLSGSEKNADASAAAH